MNDSESTFSMLFKEGCPLAPICKKSLKDSDLDGCMGKNGDQCSKSQRVMIDLLNEILAELRELNAKRK